ncbi:uracil-DNA glycosylase family protein [Rhizobium helianthi]|uniref:Type-4 uracil-DNA glycosylase n=1 Tax=Rhizobium helianthi TaxID=1132695 RepID=A0ABW4M8D7_9HYPH
MTSAQTLAPAELAALLHFYADAGCDWLLEEQPVDRIAEFAEQRAARASQAKQREPQQAGSGSAHRSVKASTDGQSSQPANRAVSSATVAIPDADAVAAARQAAAAAHSLDELRTALENFTGCNLKNGARSTVFLSGSPDSGIMVVGPMPSSDCDRDGAPFAGRAGQLLDRMLAAIDLDREKVLLTNIVAWRPPGNRPPSPAEMEICRPFFERQVELVRPKHMLLLGNFTARFFFGEEQSIFALRGAFREVTVAGVTARAIASLHPQDLLTAPANKALAWQDLLAFRAELQKS